MNGVFLVLSWCIMGRVMLWVIFLMKVCLLLNCLVS